MRQQQTIYVGVSGGVDSSVAAYLLKRQGHNVHGVFIKTWAPDWLPCTWVSEKRDAMRVCAALDIPFHFLDAEEAYRDGVAGYMIAEYRAGRTPNPDVLCNRVIKFGALWEYARGRGADAVATGHYARIAEGTLCRAKDAAKDQSYFLWMLTPEELPHIRFPLGGYTKDEVRAIAQKAGLFTAAKKDSQGICFLGDVDMREFLSRYIDTQPGPVVDRAGNVIGEHDGVRFYTLGERHGFRITAHGSAARPHYVIAKDLERNTLTVSPEKKPASAGKGAALVRLRDVNWLAQPDRRRRYGAQLRYHGALLSGKVKGEGEVAVTYSEAIPPGQSLVLYDGDALIGGGIIDVVLHP